MNTTIDAPLEWNLETHDFEMRSGADFSADRLHRLLLWRRWSIEPCLGFVMLNPSSAHETRNDPTTVRNMARARALGYGGVIQVNLYSFRTPSPAVLKALGYPGFMRGDASGVHIHAWCRMLREVVDIVLAWGAHAKPEDAARAIRFLRNAHPSKRLLHLGVLKNGQPRHPLMTAYASPLLEWP